MKRDVPGKRFGGHKPIFVLVSKRTMSGGEEAAYDLQTQKRAVLVGEPTAGGANPAPPFDLGDGFRVHIPVARAINPITHTNWEGTRAVVAVPGVIDPSPGGSPMSGRRVLITGATSGIGREAAFQMAAQGASLILVARDEARGAAVASEIAKRTGSAAPLVVRGDMSDAASIYACAEAVRREVDRLDVLVNNAGVQQITRGETRDGIELVFATNVLGYHQLTQELLPLLERGDRARVVTVASTYAGYLDFDDLEFKRRPWDNIKAYKQSKQANRLWTWALARRLRDKKIAANAMSPGFVDTGLYRDMKGMRRGFVTLLTKLFGRSVAEGADTVPWLALSPEVEGKSGLFWVDRKERRCQFRGEKDEERTWSVCEEYLARRRPAP